MLYTCLWVRARARVSVLKLPILLYLIRRQATTPRRYNSVWGVLNQCDSGNMTGLGTCVYRSTSTVRAPHEDCVPQSGKRIEPPWSRQQQTFYNTWLNMLFLQHRQNSDQFCHNSRVRTESYTIANSLVKLKFRLSRSIDIIMKRMGCDRKVKRKTLFPSNTNDFNRLLLTERA